MAAKRLGKVSAKSAGLFLCDMQEKFRKTISYYPQIIAVSNRMLQTAKLLDMPVIVTEQYPKGLGPTVSEIDVTGLPVFPKMKFSMLQPDVLKHIKENCPDLKSVVLCGIETQVCVQKTTLDMIEAGFDVHVIADAVSSRSLVDRMFSLDRMKEAGAFITTCESMILTLAEGSDHPKFRDLQKIIWDAAPDSGLLSHKAEK